MKKYFLLLLITFFSFCLIGCTKDGNDNDNDHEHEFIKGVCDCGEKDPDYKAPSTNPSFDIEYDYEMYEIFEKTNPYTEDIEFFMYFGQYPQREITDEAIVKALSEISTTNERGYIEYDGHEFAKVTVINNHYFGDDVGNNDLFYQGTNYKVGTTHYFLVEPICWRILNNPTSNELFMVTENIIDSKAFHNISSSITEGDTVIRPSDYEYSIIREWLNNYFYGNAFNDEQKGHIQDSYNKNEYTHIGLEPDPALKDTIDKVFLLSYKEVTSTLYGFFNSDSRIAKASDFARAHGLVSVPNDISSSSNWWTRTGFEYTPLFPAMVKYDGTADKPYYPQGENIGVRPAVKIIIGK